MELKSRITDNDFQFQGDKILKWLEKGQFVSVTIKVAKSSSKDEAEDVKKKIEKLVADHGAINASKLTIKLT